MGRPKSYEREEVLQKAIELFWDKGYEGTHLSELVEHTGLNRFSLYNEFGGKEGLFQAALERYIAGVGFLLDALAAEPAGLENIRTFHRVQLDHRFRHGCFALNTIREKHVAPPLAWASIEAFTTAVQEGLRANLVAARERGQLAADKDPATLATVLAVFDMGLLSYRALRPKESELQRYVEEIERLLD